MKYTSSEAMKEVLSRRDQVRRKREQRRLAWCSASLFTLLLVLTLTAASMPIPTLDASNSSAMGSFLLEAKTGGIIAAVVLAFLLGVLITLLCIRKKRDNQRTKEMQHNENGGTQP